MLKSLACKKNNPLEWMILRNVNGMKSQKKRQSIRAATTTP